uniref:Uncharacterized protein n=1 Tax=uncultured bacterium CSLF43 TaxID=1091575 RepID=G4WW34_9BACT|nr:hypothetical protein [uncultured bacterium CSLF43]
MDRRGDDLETLNETCDWPAEFLRDPSSWLEADKMEQLLKLIEEEYGVDASSVAASNVSSGAMGEPAESQDSLIVAAGHQCKSLRAWGALDSVLRMVQSPKDLFAQPERFLSYFISPAPPVGEIRREAESINFVLPVSEVQFPMVTSYLRAALEALPTYVAKPMASVTWHNSRVTISWSERQESLLSGSDSSDLQLHPELIRNIYQNMESSQKHLEEMKSELSEKDRELATLRAELAQVHSRSQDEDAAQKSPEKLGDAIHDLYRLGDYLARGQQLITLLIGQGRQTPQVQEAMRRVDWDFVSLEGPRVVRQVAADLQELRAMRDGVQDSNGAKRKSSESARGSQKVFAGFLDSAQ